MKDIDLEPNLTYEEKPIAILAKHHCRAAARQQQVAVAFDHLQQPRQHHLVVRPEQSLWAQNGEMGLRIGQRQLLNYLLAGGLAAREFVGVALRAEVFGHVAVMVVIEIDPSFMAFDGREKLLSFLEFVLRRTEIIALLK